jgi:hypothetical protein
MPVQGVDSLAQRSGAAARSGRSDLERVVEHELAEPRGADYHQDLVGDGVLFVKPEAYSKAA